MGVQVYDQERIAMVRIASTTPYTSFLIPLLPLLSVCMWFQNL